MCFIRGPPFVCFNHCLFKKRGYELALVGDGHWSVPVVEVLLIVDAHCGEDGGEEVGDADRVGDDLFAEVAGLSPGPLVGETPSGEDAGKCCSLMAPTPSAVKLRRAAKFCGDHNQCFIQQLLCFEIGDQGGDCSAELLDEPVLIEDAFVVDIPSGAIQEVEVVGDFDKPGSTLYQPSAEKTALTELAPVAVS